MDLLPPKQSKVFKNVFKTQIWTSLSNAEHGSMFLRLLDHEIPQDRLTWALAFLIAPNSLKAWSQQISEEGWTYQCFRRTLENYWRGKQMLAHLLNSSYLFLKRYEQEYYKHKEETVKRLSLAEKQSYCTEHSSNNSAVNIRGTWINSNICPYLEKKPLSSWQFLYVCQ